jgi:hypothetical protein
MVAEWLETVCDILDSFSVPLLKNAVSTIEEFAVILNGYLNFRVRKSMTRRRSLRRRFILYLVMEKRNAGLN